MLQFYTKVRVLPLTPFVKVLECWATVKMLTDRQPKVNLISQELLRGAIVIKTHDGPQKRVSPDAFLYVYEPYLDLITFCLLPL